MDTGGLINIFRKIGDLEDALCRPYIFCRRSQRVAATVSQNPINLALDVPNIFLTLPFFVALTLEPAGCNARLTL